MLDCFVYISTLADIDPVKTVLLFAPAEDAIDAEHVEVFAERSGWIEQTERDGAVLVAPIAVDGWKSCSPDLPKRIYEERRRTFKSVAGTGLLGSNRSLWAWETLIYLVGYSEGAEFAGDFLLAHPGFAAASVLVGGAGSDFAALDRPSEHWLVANPSGYTLRNRDIPATAWLVGGDNRGDTMLDVLCGVVDATELDSAECAGLSIEIRRNPTSSAYQLWRTAEMPLDMAAIARVGMAELFNHVIRWKNGPDGTLAPRLSKCEFFEGSRYRHHGVTAGGARYHYALYLPGGGAKGKDLPLVISLHGRGEPSWIFAGKNGWEDLADETGEFAVLLPDSPGNIWSYDRDADALEAMILDALSRYDLDPSRVYLTGFSNGALMTCQMATARPHLFAAASPWNSPGYRALAAGGLGSFLYADGFAASGFELPFWVCYGDADDKAPVVYEDGFKTILAANGCASNPVEQWNGGNRYMSEMGFQAGDRLETEVFSNANGLVMAGFTVVRNMPHGAIPDEARACWTFMRRFFRPQGSQHMEVLS